MEQKLNLWQRCEALGPMEDQGVQLYRTDSGDYRIFIDRATVFHVHQDGTIGDYCRAWLAEAILQRFEAIAQPSTVTRENINQKFREALDAQERRVPERLPDVTYVVEAPKTNEPTQEQLKAVWEHVTHLTGEQAEALGFQYAIIGNSARAQFELHIKSLGSIFGEWSIKIMHGHIGRYWWENPFDLMTTVRLLRMSATIPTEQHVTESPNQFVSIPVTTWEEVATTFSALAKAMKQVSDLYTPEV